MTRTLERTLTLRDLTLLVIGTVIGSGIFIIPAETLRLTGGNVPVALGVWLLGGVLSLLGALTYAEMGAMKPEAGGIYVYIRDTFGALPAFLYGWVLFFVIGPATIATLAVASTSYLAELVRLTPLAAKVVSIAVIMVLGALNIVGARESSNVINVTTLLKAGAIVLGGILLLVKGDATIASASLSPDSGVAAGATAASEVSLLAGAGIAIVGILWAYEGWQWVTFSAGETRDPQRVFPRGIVMGTAILVGIYMLANVAYLAALGTEAAARSTRIAAEATRETLGPGAAKLIAAVIVVSMFSAANSVMLTMPRVFYAMARDGLFFRQLAYVHPRTRTPAVSIAASAVIAGALAAVGTFDQLLTYVVFTAWIFYGLGALSVFVYRQKEPATTRPFKVPGYPVTPLLFVLSAAAIVINTVFTQPGRAAVGLGALAVGVPAFYAWRGRGGAGRAAAKE